MFSIQGSSHLYDLQAMQKSNLDFLTDFLVAQGHFFFLLEQLTYNNRRILEFRIHFFNIDIRVQ